MDSPGAVSRRTRTTKSIHESYQILGLAGQGQYGRVFCARPRQGGELVALKELPAERFPTPNLLRELRYLLTLNHPNITRCYALEHAREGRYLVLEYCEGGTLRELIDQVERGLWLPVKQVLGFVDQILAGLDHAHRQGVIHCDVKPENILLKPTPQGWQLKLTDFGIARHPQPAPGEIAATGSPAYMAPERFYGQFGPASDLYAVGIILLELLTGQRPFSGSPSQLMHAHLNQPFVCPEGIPAPLQELLEITLRKLPLRRFRTAAQMRSALAVFAQEWQEPASCWVGPHLSRRSPPGLQVWDLPDPGFVGGGGMESPPEQKFYICEDPSGCRSPLLLRVTSQKLEWLELQTLASGAPPLACFSLAEPLRQVLPLPSFPEALAFSKSSLLHLSPARIRTLLSFAEDWQATWLAKRQELVWATAQELGAVQWQPTGPQPFPDSHRYFRWPGPQPAGTGSLPRLLALSDYLVLLTGAGRQWVQMSLVPYPTGLPLQPGSQPLRYRLPLDPQGMAVSLGERLLFAAQQGCCPYLDSVQVNPLRVRRWFLRGWPVQMVQAPWGLLLLCREGEEFSSLWLYGEGGDPLAQVAVPVGSEVLQVGQKGLVWLQVLTAGQSQRFQLWQLDLNQLPVDGHTAEVIPLE
ncbi:serine/threonine protein kinase [Synechococcus sp. H55.5]|uniref:serine/threonine-protein kinase n=1 Tax=Synechococcus sp. H55.5 TaxID=2964507 RepID=UPI0039C3088A